MATLADVLRQTGYSQDGTLTAPATESPMTKALSEHIKTLPQQLATNQAALDSAIGSWNKTDFGTGLPNPNYRPEALAELTQLMPGIGGLTAWHGTPHKIVGNFDISKVGTGEGAQAYGHGMYFAEAPQVAETYKRAGGGLEVKYAKPLEELGINPKVATNSMDFDENPVNQGLGRIAKSLRTTALDYPDVPIDKKLVKEHFDEYIRLLDDKYPKEAAQKKALQDLVAKEGYPDINFGGNLYKVDIPDEHIPNMLDWDKPLKDQTPQVQEALKKMGSEIKFGSNKESVADFVKLTGNLPPYFQRETGHGIYSELSKQLGGDKQASEYLNSLGIKGTKYLDQQSRGKSGTSNFVAFDPSTVKILEENNKPLTRREIIEKELDKK